MTTRQGAVYKIKNKILDAIDNTICSSLTNNLVNNIDFKKKLINAVLDVTPKDSKQSLRTELIEHMKQKYAELISPTNYKEAIENAVLQYVHSNSQLLATLSDPDPELIKKGI